MSRDGFLAMDAIRKKFGGTIALRDVSITAARGEVHALVGENGAGKSTLMNILSGAVAPDSGRISIDGEPVTMASPHQANRLGVRAVHQEFSLVPHLTIAENILMGKMPSRGRLWVDWRQAHTRARPIFWPQGAWVRRPVHRAD